MIQRSLAALAVLAFAPVEAMAQSWTIRGEACQEIRAPAAAVRTFCTRVVLEETEAPATADGPVIAYRVVEFTPDPRTPLISWGSEWLDAARESEVRLQLAQDGSPKAVLNLADVRAALVVVKKKRVEASDLALTPEMRAALIRGADANGMSTPEAAILRFWSQLAFRSNEAWLRGGTSPSAVIDHGVVHVPATVTVQRDPLDGSGASVVRVTRTATADAIRRATEETLAVSMGALGMDFAPIKAKVNEAIKARAAPLPDLVLTQTTTLTVQDGRVRAMTDVLLDRTGPETAPISESELRRVFTRERTDAP